MVVKETGIQVYYWHLFTVFLLQSKLQYLRGYGSCCWQLWINTAANPTLPASLTWTFTGQWLYTTTLLQISLQMSERFVKNKCVCICYLHRHIGTYNMQCISLMGLLLSCHIVTSESLLLKSLLFWDISYLQYMILAVGTDSMTLTTALLVVVVIPIQNQVICCNCFVVKLTVTFHLSCREKEGRNWSVTRDEHNV